MLEFAVSVISFSLLGLQISMVVLMVLARILVASGVLKLDREKHGLSGFLLNFC